MSKKQTINEAPLWKVALTFSIPFIFILLIVLTAAELFKSGNLNAISNSFKDGSWLPFITIRITVATAYGFIMAFLKKSRTKTSR